MHHVLLAHGAAIERLRGMGQQNLGIVLNFDHTDAAPPADQPAADQPATEVWDGILNRWFIAGIIPDGVGTLPRRPAQLSDPHAATHRSM